MKILMNNGIYIKMIIYMRCHFHGFTEKVFRENNFIQRKQVNFQFKHILVYKSPDKNQIVRKYPKNIRFLISSYRSNFEIYQMEIDQINNNNSIRISMNSLKIKSHRVNWDSAKDQTHSNISTEYSSPDKDHLDNTSIRTSKIRQIKTVPEKHKTQLCKTFSEKGSCPYNKKCRFAHGNDELKNIPKKNQNYRKTKCKSYWMDHQCKYGIRCQYLHQRFNWIDKLILSTYKEELIQNNKKDKKESRLLKILQSSQE